MSNPAEQTLAVAAASASEEEEAEQRGSDNDNTSEQSQEWETMARAWLCSFPEARAVSMAEVEAWIDSNFDFIPEGIKSMPRADLCQRLISIQNCMRLPNQDKEENQLDTPHARFQRTDQWRPVYSWLETLDKDEVVKSKDISDWLTANPKIQEQLCSRHSRYHLMHYIKKCHMKILKRREKKKGVQQPERPAPLKVHKDVMRKQPDLLPSPLSVGNSLINVPKDGDAYLTKRKEAFQKFEILVELEKLLSPAFLKRQDVNR